MKIKTNLCRGYRIAATTQGPTPTTNTNKGHHPPPTPTRATTHHQHQQGPPPTTNTNKGHHPPPTPTRATPNKDHPQQGPPTTRATTTDNKGHQNSNFGFFRLAPHKEHYLGVQFPQTSVLRADYERSRALPGRIKRSKGGEGPPYIYIYIYNG